MDKELKLMEDGLVAQIEALRADVEAIQQPRSNFAIRHFVVGQHDMPGRQRAQAVLELQIRMFNIRRGQLSERELRAKIAEKSRIVNGNYETHEQELARIEVERMEVDLAELQLARLGAIRETECLLEILKELPEYTHEQYQEEEAEYWRRRLSRQALNDMRASGAISAGNLDAIRQYLGVSAPQLDETQIRALLGE